MAQARDRARYRFLRWIWDRAEAESSSAEAVLGQVGDSESQVAWHLLRGWKILAFLVQKETSESTSVDDAAYIPDMDAGLIKSTIANSPLVQVSPKLKARIEKEIDALASINWNDLKCSALTDVLKEISLSDFCDDYYDVMSRLHRAFKDKYYPGLLRRMGINGMYVLLSLLAVLICAYVITGVRRGQWNPIDWTRPNLKGVVVKSSRQEWGVLQMHKSVISLPLTIAGVKYTRGLGTHANSTIQIETSGGRTLKGACGLDSECPQGTVQCEVQVGGQVVFQSGIMKADTPAATFEVPLNGNKEVVLVFKDAGDGITCDHGDWVDLSVE